MRLTGSILFFVFCLLLAARDVYTSHITKIASPSFLLFIYCVGATILSWIVYSLRTRVVNVWYKYRLLPKAQKDKFLYLGLATCIVYGSTIWGLSKLNPAVFGAVDYGAMPFTTLLADRILMGNKISKARAIGMSIALVGIILFFSERFKNLLDIPHYYIWLLVALLSPIFTAYCSVLQKEQVQAGMKPEEVLLFRFPIPAIAFFLWWALDKFPITSVHVGSMLIATVCGVFLPLWLLCIAFVREAVGTLAGYLFLIPVLIFGLTWIFFPDQRTTLSHPGLIAAIVLIIVGSCVFEGILRLPKSKIRRAAAG